MFSHFNKTPRFDDGDRARGLAANRVLMVAPAFALAATDPSGDLATADEAKTVYATALESGGAVLCPLQGHLPCGGGSPLFLAAVQNPTPGERRIRHVYAVESIVDGQVK